MKIFDYVKCLICGNERAILFEEPRYNGLRGICEKCDGNWAES